MLRALALALVLASPAFAEPGQDYRTEEAPDGTVRIVVSLKDLPLCQLTLAMVLTPAVVDEQGNVVGFEAVSEQGLPPAVCVTDEG